MADPAEVQAQQAQDISQSYIAPRAPNPLVVEAIQRNPNAYIPPNPQVTMERTRGDFPVFGGGQAQVPFALLALRQQPVGQMMMANAIKQLGQAPKADPRVELNVKNRFQKEIMQEDWIDNTAKFGANRWAEVMSTGTPRTPEEAQALATHTKKMNALDAMANMSTMLGKHIDELNKDQQAGHLINPNSVAALDFFHQIRYDQTTPTDEIYDRMVQADSYLTSTQNLKSQIEQYLPTNALLNRSFTINQAYDEKGKQIPGSYTVVSTENDENGNPRIDPSTGKPVQTNLTQDLRNRANAMWQEHGDELKNYGIKDADQLFDHFKYVLPHAQEVKLERPRTTNVNIYGEKEPRYYEVAAQAFNKAIGSFQKDYSKISSAPADILYSDFAHRLPYRNDGTMNADPSEGNTLGVNIKQWNNALNTKIKSPDFTGQGSEKYFLWAGNKMNAAETASVNVDVKNDKKIPLQELFSESLSEPPAAGSTTPTSPLKKYAPSLTITGTRQVFGNDTGEGQPDETIKTEDQFREMAKGNPKWKPYFEVQYNLSYTMYDKEGKAKLVNQPIRQYIDATNPDLVSMFDHKMEGMAESRADINPNLSIPVTTEAQMTK